jgi:DNA-binding MarR family transcriptional regulator
MVLRIAEVDDETELRHLLGDVVGVVEPQLVELWRRTGLTFVQRRLLRRLGDGPRSAGALAAELGIAAPSLTRQLQKLEDRRLITRQVDRDDRRRVLVALTSTGQSALTERKVSNRGPLALAIKEMSPRQQRDLARSLRVLVQLARRRQAANADD